MKAKMRFALEVMAGSQPICAGLELLQVTEGLAYGGESLFSST